MIPNLCSIELNGEILHIQPFFDPIEISPKIHTLLVYKGEDFEGNYLFKLAPPWLHKMANNYFYDTILSYYD